MRHALALPFVLAALAGCSPSMAAYEVGELEEERVHAAVKSIAGGIEARNLEKTMARFDPAYSDPGFDCGVMTKVAAADGLVVANWAPLCASATEANGIRAFIAAYIAEWKVVSRAQAKIRRVTLNEDDPLLADGIFFFDVYGVSVAGEAREDHLYAKIDLRKDGPAWVITRFRIESMRCIFSKRAQFVNIAREAGAEFVHTQVEGWKGAVAMPEAGADSGLACGDYDDDGDFDLYLINGGPGTLLRNRGDGTFDDVTAEAGVADPEGESRGGVFGDFDNDGDQDLFLSNSDAPTRLYRNNGDGTFTDATAASGIDFTGFGTGVTCADYDRDGLLDIYQCVYGAYHSENPTPPAQKEVGTNLLWHNLGGLRFEEVAADLDVDDRGWSLAASWGDVNDDGWPDLLLANDFGDKKLFVNDEGEDFDEVAEDWGIVDRGFGMSAAFGDVDNDGDFDMYFSNMYSNTNWIFEQEELIPVPWFLGWLRNIILGQLSDMTLGNTLWLNDGPGKFRDVTDQGGVGYGQWAWGSEFLDYDADGDLDIYCVNGFLSGYDAEDL